MGDRIWKINVRGVICPVEVWMSGDTITFTRLYTLAGSNRIVYEGGQWTKFEYKIDPNIIDSNRYGKIIAQTKWKITFTMREVTDGGLQIDVDYEPPTPSFLGNYEDSNSLKWIKARLEEMYAAAGDNFEWYVHSIRDCLKGREKFTLPASGVYYFKNPIMNSRGDFLCGLEYNGNPILGGQINTTTKNERDSVSTGDLTALPAVAVFSASEDGKKK